PEGATGGKKRNVKVYSRMLTISTWKWNGTREFTSQHVNTLFRAVADNLTLPHRFVCITDDAAGLDDNITVVPLPEFNHIKVRPGFPSCYIRLKAFEPEFAKTIGERILTLDLDTVITGDITPLVDRDEDLVLWRRRSEEHTSELQSRDKLEC